MNLGVAEAASPETLQEAWLDAYRNNPSLQAERAGLRATDEGVAQAQSHWRPSIDATGTIGRTYQYLPAQKSFGTADFAGTTRGYGVQVTQPLFRGWRTDSETDEAEGKVLSGRAKLRDAEQQLFLDAATAFLAIVRDETILGLQRDSEQALEGKLRETEARAKVGDLTETDVDQAKSRLARAEVARFQAESTLNSDRASYLRLVGHVPEHLQTPDLAVDPARSRDDILAFAEKHNPKVIAARYDFDAAKADIDLTKGSLLPELDLVGNAGRNWGQSSTLPGRIDSSQIQLQLTMPLYRSGADYSKARASQQTATQRRLEFEEARHKAHEAADNGWQAFEASKAALEADKVEVGASSKAFEGVKIQARAGTRTTLDVLNAEQEWIDARVDLAKSQHDRDLAVIQIAAAMGELTVDHLLLPVEAYDPERHYHDVRNQWVGFSDDDARYGVPAATGSETEAP
jgi:outer membrane protein